VKEKKIIKPGNISVLKRKNTASEITLMTCWPVGTTLNRMIVI
jgi:LPXTG-site transpeptidase (sortase) family protein